MMARLIFYWIDKRLMWNDSEYGDIYNFRYVKLFKIENKYIERVVYISNRRTG